MCAYSVDMRSAQYGYIKSKKEQVRDVIFTDIIQFSHDDLMAFGLTCKSNDLYLRTACDRRKACIREICLDTFLNVVFNCLHWHGYGSRAEYKKIVDDSESTCTKKKLMLARLELANKGSVKEYFGTWSNFQSELWYKPVPFYTINKELCFFGHGWIDVAGCGSCGNIVHYKMGETIHFHDAIERQPRPFAMRCKLHFKKSTGEEMKEVLCQLLEFPHLLKAIINSGQYAQENVYKEDSPYPVDTFLVFDLEKIIIPDNYKEWGQYHKRQICCSAFDQLPRDLPYAITKRYEEQKIIF